ncbi:2-methylaconitate cis-trans isomerase PrpF family protein [Aliikangiella sp. IMCC44359]|uniref:2-methylaconitate cis-trans isomerase PrpF family protein n=1 Tax=Aliikangiella sp. IMCC44359 TaxID=3459125 RepID=UPI00403AFEDD
MTQATIPAVWMRGGTSKGIFFLKEDLPQDPVERDPILLQVLGSPDPYGRQIDGIGGATSSTSKIAIISLSDRDDCDIEFCFGAVSINKPLIDYSGTCGNLSSAVGVFAIEQGLLTPKGDGLMTVYVWQTNLNQRFATQILIKNGIPESTGDYSIAGVIGKASPIRVDFLLPGLAADNSVLPTGNPVDLIKVPNCGDIEVSLIAAGNNTVFVRAKDLKLEFSKLASRLASDSELAELLESIRCLGAVKMNAAPTAEFAREQQPATPKIAIIDEPSEYISSHGKVIATSEQDISARILSMGTIHHAFTGTGTIATGVAACIPGTIISELLPQPLVSEQQLKIAHPGGVIEVGAEVVYRNERWIAERASITRTARTLMKGQVYYSTKVSS